MEVIHGISNCLLSAAVGKAFGEDSCPHPDILKALFGDEKEGDLSNPWRKMAIVCC